MALTTPDGPFSGSPYLTGLIAEVEQLAQLVGRAPEPSRRRLAAHRLEDAVRATLALDGAAEGDLPDLARAEQLVASGLATADDTTTDEHAADAATTDDRAADDRAADDRAADEHAADDDASHVAAAHRSRPGTWLDAMGTVHEPSDEQVRALEVVGAAAALSADDLAGMLTGGEAAAALTELHRRSTRGLVAPDQVGAPRSTDQAVHDASIGRILYLPVPTERITERMASITAWLHDRAGAMPSVVASGVLHAELLHVHPYDAASGRVARAAGRLLLRAGGLDPDGLAAPEPELAADPMAYHQAMADTLRRRDPRLWVERCAEAVAAGLRTSAWGLGLLTAAAPPRATRFVDGREDAAFTLADYLGVVDGDRDAAEADLRALLDAGRITRVLGTNGLRYRVATTSPDATPSSHDATTST